MLYETKQYTWFGLMEYKVD